MYHYGNKAWSGVSLTISSSMTLTCLWSSDDWSVIDNCCSHVAVWLRWAIPGKGGRGELHAQHGGDVLHLRPLHPQTGKLTCVQQHKHIVHDSVVPIKLFFTSPMMFGSMLAPQLTCTRVCVCLCVCRTCVWCVVVLDRELKADCWPVLSVDNVTTHTVSMSRSVQTVIWLQNLVLDNVIWLHCFQYPEL